MWPFLLLGYEWDNVCEMGETADRRWERLQLDALTMELLMWDNESNNKKAHSWDQLMLSKWGWNMNLRGAYIQNQFFILAIP
jgi:hypothetical protein